MIKLFGRIIKGVFKLISNLIVFFILTVLTINLFVIGTTYQSMYATDELVEIPEKFKHQETPILVLGAGIIDNAYPSTILELRLQATEQTYQIYPEKPLIMSGDHRESNYNEVAVMKNYLIEQGLPSNQIYLDHAGYSTYDSLYRLKHVFHQDQVIIITQKYHLSRALMLAKTLNIDAVGIIALENSSTRMEREGREILARIKDFSISYLGFVPGNPSVDYSFSFNKGGDATNEKELLEKD